MPEGAFYAYPSVKGLLGRDYDGRGIDTSAELSEYILDAAEVAVVPRRGVRLPRLPATLLRTRRRRPGRGHHPPAEAVRLTAQRLKAQRSRDLSGCRRRTCTCTSRGPCATRPSSSWPQRDGIVLPDPLDEEWPPQLSAADEKGWFRFQRLYDVARSVLRTPGDVRRLVLEAAEDDVRDGGRWLEIQVDPSGYAARFGGITAFTDLVLDCVRDASRAHRPGHRGDHRRQPHPPPDGCAGARTTGRAVRRPRRRRLRALQRRAPRARLRSSHRRSRSPGAAGWH